MREINFRAWDGKTMWWNQFCVTSYGKIQRQEIAREWHSWHNEDWTLIQFTGLKDKNGKEIYEGDIIQTSNLKPKENEDTWKPEDWGYAVVTIDAHGVHFTNEGQDWSWDQQDTVYHLDFLEVIGNIYENPELLEQNTNKSDQRSDNAA